MKHGLLKKLLPHGIAVVIFLLVAVIYCRPALQGMVLQQSDVTEWKAMAKNSFDYKEKHGHFPLWSNGMFSGMPAYQIAMESQNPVPVGVFYTILTLGLPKPISFFFLACVCFYFLSQALRVNPYIGIIGALAYAYATYNPIIIAVGHETKMQAIAMMPFLIGSLIWVYEKKYLLGGALTALSSALLIGMNHPQITYYAGIIALFMTIAYVIRWVRAKDFRHLLTSLAIVVVAGLLGLLTNAVTLLTTSEYVKYSIRGGSELAADSSSTKSATGLSEDYALSYSMYQTEPFVMMVPKMFGGSSSLEVDETSSKAIEQLQQMPPQLAQQLQGFLGSYWGGIGGTSGPPYVGAIICTLMLLGFLLLDSQHKWWILACSILAILMSWGSYFRGFNVFLLHTLPLYNKFRAPSMILVIPTFLFCMMAILTLQKVISSTREELKIPFKKGLYVTGGVFLFLFILYFSFDYKSANDKAVLQSISTAPDQVKAFANEFFKALQEDRKGLFFGSLMRTLFFAAAAMLLVWLRLKNTIQNTVFFAVMGLLAFADVMMIDTRYLNAEHYQDKETSEAQFQPSPQDVEILKDTSYYRVFDTRQGIDAALGMAGARPSYFHKSIGGYHPAKLSIYQDLIEKQLSKFPEGQHIFNMLNTKYFIGKDAAVKDMVSLNADALGAAWFVQHIVYRNTAPEVMKALDNLDPATTAVLFEKDKSLMKNSIKADSTSNIRIIKNDNDIITYASASATGGFGVFSEVFYEKGWKAFIDGKEVPIIRTNYVLRGIEIPAGNHEIIFRFQPASYYNGETYSLIASILIWLALLATVFYYVKRQKKNNVVAAKRI